MLLHKRIVPYHVMKRDPRLALRPRIPRKTSRILREDNYSVKWNLAYNIILGGRPYIDLVTMTGVTEGHRVYSSSLKSSTMLIAGPDSLPNSGYDVREELSFA